MNYPEVLPTSVLHWNYRGLTEFPIEQLKDEEAEVTDIYLKENLLSRLPNDIGTLIHLESLYISGNDITELPKDISNLKCLKCLDASGNRLKKIPNEIGDVKSLKFLILDENELSELPLRIAELRFLRYLSVCDNKLKWLPQRPVYNYHHCELRFWRNSNLRCLPYSLWYHMFRNQQTRSLNIACLNSANNAKTPQGHKCRLKLRQDSKEWDFDVHCPPQYNTIQESCTNTPPSLFELSKRFAYVMISEAAKKISTDPYSLYSEPKYYSYQTENNNVTNLNDNLNSININDTLSQNINSQSKRKDNWVPKDIMEDYFHPVPNIIKEDLVNGPVSKCENCNCRKAVFDEVHYEFTFGKLILIDSVQEVVLSAAFCSKSCADVWKGNGIATIPWTLFKKPDEQQTPPKKYFKGHECHILCKDPYGPKCGPLRRFFLNITTVRPSDIRARNIFKSYAALCAEQERQYRFFPLSIHPFSMVRLCCDAYTVIIMLVFYTFLPIYFSKPIPKSEDFEIFVLCMFDLLYFVSIIINTFTGYVDGKTNQFVVLSLKNIWLRYVTTWLVVDIMIGLSCLPTMLMPTKSLIWVHAILSMMKLLRLPSLLGYLSNVTKVLYCGIIKRTLLEITVLLYSYLTWNIYLQFVVEFIMEKSYQPVNPRNCSWITQGNLWNETAQIRILYALERAVGMLRKSTNVNRMLLGQECYETFILAAWLLAKFLVYHCVLKYIVTILGSESSRSRYYIMRKQVENYMNNKRFPPRIKQKILKFYAIRFQFHYIAEEKMLACLTGQLKEDILMHTGRQLVKELAFLKQLPRPLYIQIVLKLRIVIFIAGDIIIKINTVGDCLYIIDKGTVAIYSESGNEICHLEDGDFFGEIALVMKHSFRTASAVAVTNCELFRLDKEDFDTSIACYPTVHENIKKVAISRYERTCVLDEHYKTQIANELGREYSNDYYGQEP